MSRFSRFALPVGLICVVDVVLIIWLGRAQFADQALSSIRIWDDHLLFAVRHYQQDLSHGASFLPEMHAHWGAGVFLRVAGFLLLHGWLALVLAGPIRHHGQRDAVATPALLSGPPAGVLAGLISAIPEGFTSGSTVESRELVRALAVNWMLDGAIWGLLCGSVAALVCALVLAARLGAALLGLPGAPEKPRSVTAIAVPQWRLMLALIGAGCLAAVAQSAILDLVATAVGRTPQLFGAPPGGRSAGESLSTVLSFVRWWAPPQFGPLDVVPGMSAFLAWVSYSVAVFGFAALVAFSLSLGRRREAMRCGLAGSLVAAACYLVTAATVRQLLDIVRFPSSFAGRSRADILGSLMDSVANSTPEWTAYSAIIGWWPFAAMALALAGWRKFKPRPALPASTSVSASIK
jgi:hypothetical protein